jgi:hypothetical protein
LCDPGAVAGGLQQLEQAVASGKVRSLPLIDSDLEA